MLAAVIMMNNYFHDVATALLAGSALVMLMVLRELRGAPEPAAVDLAARVYRRMTRVAWFALGWIVLGGIPRLIFFADLELWDAASKAIVPALGIKHVLMFTVVALGVIMWRRLSRRLAELQGAST